MRAVNVAVCDFFFSRIAYAVNCRFEQDFHAGKRMVAVYYGFAVCYIGYAINQDIAGFRIIGFEHHADFHFNREYADIFDTHQAGILFAERIIGRQRDFNGITDVFLVQSFFHQRENAVISAVQIGDGFFGFVQQLVIRIVHFIVKRNHGIFFNSHSLSFIMTVYQNRLY